MRLEPDEPVIVRTTKAGIKATCNVCGQSTTAPNKGLGRAKVAAWKTRHQHIGEDRA